MSSVLELEYKLGAGSDVFFQRGPNILKLSCQKIQGIAKLNFSWQFQLKGPYHLDKISNIRKISSSWTLNIRWTILFQPPLLPTHPCRKTWVNYRINFNYGFVECLVSFDFISICLPRRILVNFHTFCLFCGDLFQR